MGSCNCGNLAQELTHLTKAQIHEFAMQRMGDWNEQVLEYCPDSGFPIDAIIGIMLDAGLSLKDIRQLEKLSCPEILKEIPEDEKPLAQNRRDHVVKYMKAWVKILESGFSDRVQINSFNPEANPVS